VPACDGEEACGCASVEGAAAATCRPSAEAGWASFCLPDTVDDCAWFGLADTMGAALAAKDAFKKPVELLCANHDRGEPPRSA